MKFFELVPQGTNIDFIGKFKYFVVFSIASIIFTIGGMWSHGLNYGIDFTGGSITQVKFTQPKNAEDVRKLVADVGEPDASVVALGKESQEYLITARSAKEQKDQAPLAKRLLDKSGPGSLVVQSSSQVGPKVGAELRLAALRSLFYTVILITIYIWFRFDFRSAPGATVAMVHDLMMTTGFYLVTQREFTITAVAALLTIAGYSVNDTIVVYDRVREMFKRGGDNLPLAETINKAVNITLSRTLLTSGITLISILPIIFLTTGEIQSFAIAMVFGIFVGTYSTIYIASPMTIYVQKLIDSRSGKKQPAGRPKPATV